MLIFDLVYLKIHVPHIPVTIRWLQFRHTFEQSKEKYPSRTGYAMYYGYFLLCYMLFSNFST